MKVIIAEKPSVAKNIADALGNTKRMDGYIQSDEYYITWAYGHLLQLFDSKDYNPEMAKWKLSNFPFIPEEFKYKIKSDMKDRDKPDAGAKSQLKVIKGLIEMKDVTGVISATDFDREGQIIGDIIINFLQVKKPIERLLLNEWTPDEVANGLKRLKPNSSMKSVSDAGSCRQYADWAIGINLTTVSTLLYKKSNKGPVNIGRVLLPTLKIIYDRDKEIEGFISDNFFKLTGKFETRGGESYEGSYTLGTKDKFLTKEELKDVVLSAKGKDAKIEGLKTERKKEFPPYLFNLTNLQGHITSKYSGWTSQKVLKVAQALYEGKFLTYPRTASFALDESLVDRTEKVLNAIKKGLPYEGEIKFSKNPRVFDNSKVEGHSAIIPTYVVPTKLTADEQIVYNEVKDRFIMQFLPISEYDETVISTKINGIGGNFITKGKTVIVLGWKKVQNVVTKEITLPKIKIYELVKVAKLGVSTHSTKPPVHHTEKTLLKVMESCGRGYNKASDDSDIMEEVLNGFSIGTPATRADTINKLNTAGYIEPKGKSLICSDLGKILVEVFPANELFDLEYTGKLEKTLLDIEKGKVSKKEFLDFVFDFTRKSVEKIIEKGGICLNDGNNVDTQDAEVLGACPKCGAEVTEGQKAFGCNDWKTGCKFSIWKNDRYLASMKKEPTAEMVKALLTEGKTLVKGLVSKKGNTFDAILSYEENLETGYFNWKMEFPDKK